MSEKASEDINKKGTGAHRGVWLYVGLFLFSVIMYVAVLVLEDAYPFGSRCFLTDDAYVQYNTMIRVFLEYIHSGDMSQIMWNHGMGIDMYLNALYYFMSPFNIIAVALGENYVELSLVIMIVLKCSLIPVTGLYYFRHTDFADREKGLSGIPGTMAGLCCALAWGFCGYILAYGHNVLWIDGLIILPLLALGVERINRGTGFKAYVIWLAVSFIVNFYYSFYICIFVIMYHILLERSSFREFLANSLRILMYSLLSVAISAVALLPAVLCIARAGESYTGLDQTGLAAWGDIGGYVVSFFSFKEITSSSYLYNNNNYIGTAAVLLALCFLGAKGVRRLQKTKCVCIAVVLMLAANWLPLNYVFHGFTITHGVGNRFAMLLSFLMVVLAYKMLIELGNMRASGAVFGAVCAILLLVLSFTDSSRLQAAVCYVTFMLVSAVVVIVLILVSAKSIRKETAAVIITALWAVEITANVFYTLPSKSNECAMTDSIYLDEWLSEYQELDSDGGERKTSLVYSDYTPASDLNWYSSMLNGYSVDAFAGMGLGHYDNVECLYDGATPLTAMMYDVRYVLAASYNTNGGYHRISEGSLSDGESYGVYEADELAGLGFMADSSLEQWRADGDVGENQSSFVSLGYGAELESVADESLMEVIGFGNIRDECMSVTGQYNVYSIEEGLNITSRYNLGSFVSMGVGKYEYTSESTYPASVHLAFTADRDMNLYVYSYDTRDQLVMAYVDGELVSESKYYTTGQLVHVGQVKKGQKVKIAAFGGASQGETAEKILQLYNFSDELFEQVKAEITDEVLVSDGYSGNTFTGHITAKKAGVLYLAFPYSDGYTIYVDGEKADKLLLGAGNMGVRLGAGEHVIELRYHTSGLLPGAVISLVGIAVFVLLILKKWKKLENV